MIRLEDYIWLIPALPLAGFVVNGLFRSVFSKTVVSVVACGVMLLAFALSAGVFLQVKGQGALPEVYYFDWIRAGGFNLPFSLLVDQLSSLMLLVITGVGLLIHIYSTAYMHDDRGYGKFFAYLNLFVFFMLLLVMGANYGIMFVGWEGVGLCSYLLIGFWYTNPAYANAAKKAFVMNRIGDLGFLAAAFTMIAVFNSLDFSTVLTHTTLLKGGLAIGLITFGLFIAACGKSAQLPLFTWLPDAMAGPTPVSALIHAATMVTAGIYMIIRSNALFELAPLTLEVISYVGAATALVAALIAVAQTDIKKVLAYSTVSQLGYMVLALGVHANSAAFFHVLTHAFFKALLFLGAGSVIHAMHHEQDMRKMGGLRKRLPVTFATMLAGTIAISGIPPFSGFFSKDEILAATFEHNKLLWAVGLLTAFLTAFYMFRMLFLTFSGGFRNTHIAEEGVHEGGSAMTVPLVILAVLAAFGGVINLPRLFGGNEWLTRWLLPVAGHHAGELPHDTELILMAASVLAAGAALALAWVRYVKQRTVPVADEIQRPFVENALYRKLYLDELYEAAIVRPVNYLSNLLYRIIDRRVIDGAVNGVADVPGLGGRALRLLQTGNVGFYIFAMVFSIAGLLVYTLFYK